MHISGKIAYRKCTTFFDIFSHCVMLEECREEYIYRSKDGCVEECRKPVEQSVGGCAVSTDFVGRISSVGMLCHIADLNTQKNNYF